MTLLPPGFDYSGVKWWVEQAQDHQKKGQPMLSFICAWIAFNNCYGQSWARRRDQLIESGKESIRLRNLSGQTYDVDIHEYVLDNFQIASFVGSENPDFKAFWKHFSENVARSFVETMRLPIMDLVTHNSVPDSFDHEVKLLELDVPTLFRVLLTIRNNLFHGGKQAVRSRDVTVCSCAAEFMVPFVEELTNPDVLSEEEPD